VLNFFYDRHTNPRGFDPAQRDGWHVIYASKGAVPTQSPPDCEVTQSIGVSFRSIWSLPPARVIWPDGSGLGHIQDYAKLSLALRGNVPGAMGCHRIGGWPDEVYGEMRVVCALASNGVNCIGAIDSSDQRVQKLWRSDPDEWRLLFQLNPYDVPFNETSWAYVDTGRPFFWIACADLAARRFDKVWCLSP
jgi:hypothetical protein